MVYTVRWGLIVERRVHQEIHCRGPLVTRHEALAEIPREVVKGGIGASLDDSTHGTGESLLHVKAWKRIDNLGHLRPSQCLAAPAATIEPDSRGTQCDLRFLVEANGRRRVERDAIPDQLRPAVIDALVAGKPARD